MDLGLNGKVVLVTGAARDIGLTSARRFAAEGALVMLADRDAGTLTEAAASVPGSRTIATDLTADGAADRVLDATLSAFGRLDVLVNNAGISEPAPIATTTPESWRRVLALNLDHQFFACQAVRPQMRAAGGGAIVNLSSIVWMGGGAADLVAYSAAKAAIVGMTNSLAREYGDDGIRVNAIAPGAVLTRRQLELWYTDAAQVAAVIARQCLKARLAGMTPYASWQTAELRGLYSALVDARGRFVSQRELPQLATITPELDGPMLSVRAGAMHATHELDWRGPLRSVTIWGDVVEATDQGDAMAEWFSEAAGVPLRLVAFGHAARRPIDPDFTPRDDAETAFPLVSSKSV